MFKAFSLVAIGIAAVSAEYGDEDLPDCTCKSSWLHNEYKCNSTVFPDVKAARFNGCPKLSELSKCEFEPEQSWCETKQEKCKQQTGNSIGESWVYCDAKSQEPMLPYCTCKAEWRHKEGNCANMKGGLKMNGCPSIKQLKQCQPDMDEWYGQSWCDTVEPFCFEQENWEDEHETNKNETHMIGAGWSFCNEDSGEAELPNCDCGDEETGTDLWRPTEGDCRTGANPTFQGCVTEADWIKNCGNEVKYGQAWCNTKQSRCKQQSDSVDYNSMVDNGWAYCDPETWYAELPYCECRDEWEHADYKCYDNPLAMKGCPTIGQVGVCEFHATESWCDTTYDTCQEQGSESMGDGWSFCDAATQETELPPCECKASWTNDAGDGVTDVCDKFNSAHFRGCPTLEEIQRCEAATELSWCETTELACRDQTEDAYFDGWVYCDPVMQQAIPASGVGKAVGITFFLTVMFCVALFVGFLLGYRRYLNRHKRGYSQELLEGDSNM